MAARHHNALFHPRLVKTRVEAVDPVLYAKHRETIDTWLEHLRSGTLDATKETSLHGGFLERIFGDVLGYSTMGTAKAGTWDLVAEKSMRAGGSADGALGRFAKGSSHVVAPIELKGADQFLDHAKGRSLNPIQQGWDYANKAPESRWIIVSNYRETRLYAKATGQAAYELFLLEELATEAGFRRFVGLLGRDAMLGGPSLDQTPLAEMLVASEIADREVTGDLYKLYTRLRSNLYEELCRKHSNRPASETLGYAQTILDRLLFIAFAEDRGLLPSNTIAKAFEHKDAYEPRPVWQNFLAVFRAVDKGSATLGIPAYNGGLFRANPDLEELELSDGLCEQFKKLSEYDFRDDVSVDVLGHIFEQSISDLEELRRQAESQLIAQLSGAPEPTASVKKTVSKRRAEGVFYTPAFVTSFLVRDTIGKATAEAWTRARGDRSQKKADRILTWEAYQDELRKLRVLDPACGSGAFLIAAFDALAAEFERANRALAELRGQQTSLFDLNKTVLNENLFGIDKSGESVEITKLALWLKTAERGKRLTFLDRNVLQGNSVVTDPTVDPLAFDWAVARSAHAISPSEGASSLELAGIDARWREGFDVVLGNPPYVRHELLADFKPHWSSHFETYDGVADLFVYFFERGFQQLKPGGRLGFIVSNKWLRGGYAEKLRALLGSRCTVESMIDFGHAPVFPDADAFPCIITLRKELPPADHAVRVTLYPREVLHKEQLAGYVDAHAFPLPQATLDSKGWVLEPAGVSQLLEKLKRNGVPLADYAGAKPYYGIKTGLNEAFLVDQATRDRLCSEDPRSAEILKKYLRGQDIARWEPEWAGLWMIFARRGINIDSYPAVKNHLTKHRPALEPRPRDFAGMAWPGRKPGSYKWYELQDSIDYFELFEQPKLVWKDISFHPEFTRDNNAFYTNDLCFILPTSDDWLLATLNSPAMWAWLHRNTIHGKDEALRLKTIYMLRAPIPHSTEEVREMATERVSQLVTLTRQQRESTAAIHDYLRIEHQIESPGQVLSDLASLDSDAFIAAIKARRPKKPALSVAGLKQLRDTYASEVAPIRELRAQALQHERALAAAVHDAWGLTPDDLELLRASAPPRMPPGW